MTDLARLKSRIAEFARRDDAVPAQPSVRAGAFLAALAGKEFDAVHVQGPDIRGTYGQTQDLLALARTMARDKSAEATLFICAADHDPDYVLFCGADGDQAVVLRTRRLSMDTLTSLWHACDPSAFRRPRKPGD